MQGKVMSNVNEDDLEKMIMESLSLPEEKKKEPKESNLTTCRKCGSIKKRILVGKWTESKKDKKFVNEDGIAWNGRTCPDCHRRKQAKIQKRRRDMAKEARLEQTIEG